jgi:hypothetical protein
VKKWETRGSRLVSEPGFEVRVMHRERASRPPGGSGGLRNSMILVLLQLL